MSFATFAEQNRAAWNAAALKHKEARRGQLEQNFAQPGYVIFDEWERALLARLPVKGRDVAHLPCNNGRELISLVNWGARYGVGFDIAEENIQWANRLKACANANCDFYRTNLMEIGHEFNAHFDFVYISEGSLIWFEDLRDYFAVVARLLKPGGWVLIHEEHPITNIFDYTFDEHAPIVYRQSYFTQGPLKDDGTGLDYIGKTDYAGPATYEFPHTLADIVNSLIKNALEIMELQELAEDIVNGFAYLEKLHRFPLSFALLARKSAK